MFSPRHACRSLLIPACLFASLFAAGTSAALTYPEFVDPHPSPGNHFGEQVVALTNGNVVVTAPYDDAVAPGAGAVYLFSGSTGALISTLSGYSADDRIGSSGVVALTNGNFVVLSPVADIGGNADAGAVTWVNGSTGLTAYVSSVNSLVGGYASDLVGNGGAFALPNGNYVVTSPSWHSGGIAYCGAATFGSGTTGISGLVSAANSLVGSNPNDAIGSGDIAVVGNSNYVVLSTHWNNIAGAVTWCSGTTGRVGTISASNSVAGQTSSDEVGSGGVTVLTNGNYVIRSPIWHSGPNSHAGAVTFGYGNSGATGYVSSGNSLVGSTQLDAVGSAAVIALSNGNYVVPVPHWANGAVQSAGAVTWCSGTTGRAGTISSANSLVGTTASDQVGWGGVLALSNGNYVVCSPNWNNGAVVDAGAVTWANGTTGLTGAVTSANSMTTTQASANVGAHGAALTNGHYVTATYNWDNGAVADVGAVTWGNGTIATSGVVSAANSLLGSSTSDQIGYALVALANGNYVVGSPFWHNAAAANAGAVTWCNGSLARTGTVSAANSLVGSTAGDMVGGYGITLLANNHYVVSAQNWDNGAIVDAGAVTWLNQNSAFAGAVSSANSLVGTHSGDQVGSGGVRALPTGHFVVSSPSWDNGAIVDAGAVTWCSGVASAAGTVSTSNSLYGTSTGDGVGTQVAVLQDGSWVTLSPSWDNAPLVNVGAVTWASAGPSSIGPVSQSNSVFGFHSNAGLQFVTLNPQQNAFAAGFRTEESGHVRVGPLADFTIAGAMDVSPDQGGWLRVVFARSPYDSYYSSSAIQTYGVWRRIPGTVPQYAPAHASEVEGGSANREADLETIASSLPAGVTVTRTGDQVFATVPPTLANGTMPTGTWELVATVPAFARSSYIAVIPTITNLSDTEILVTAHTPLNTVWFATPTVIGQSVDNLAPAQPAPFAGAYAAGGTHLTWGANPENDLAGYRLYRGSDVFFTPSLANRIATPGGTVFDDATAGAFVYKLSAVDVNGNESPVATVIPAGTTGVDAGPVAFTLDGVRPNPANGRALQIAFALPSDRPAKLELLDVSGRRLAAREVGALGAGRHSVNLSEARAIPAGLYWARLTQGSLQRSVRVAVVE